MPRLSRLACGCHRIFRANHQHQFVKVIFSPCLSTRLASARPGLLLQIVDNAPASAEYMGLSQARGCQALRATSWAWTWGGSSAPRDDLSTCQPQFCEGEPLMHTMRKALILSTLALCALSSGCCFWRGFETVQLNDDEAFSCGATAVTIDVLANDRIPSRFTIDTVTIPNPPDATAGTATVKATQSSSHRRAAPVALSASITEGTIISPAMRPTSLKVRPRLRSPSSLRRNRRWRAPIRLPPRSIRRC